MKVDCKRIQGVIFDMDGVLVDSEPAMARSAVEGMAEYGITALPEDFTPYLGTDEKTYFGCTEERIPMRLAAGSTIFTAKRLPAASFRLQALPKPSSASIKWDIGPPSHPAPQRESWKSI